MRWWNPWWRMAALGCCLCLLFVACSDVLPNSAGEESSGDGAVTIEGTKESVAEPSNESMVTDAANEPNTTDRAGESPQTEPVPEAAPEPVVEPAPEKSQGLRVQAMTFNIRLGVANDGDNAWLKRKSMVFAIIRQQGGDFVGMQEAWKFQIDDVLKAVPTYKCLGRGRQVNPETDEWSPICYLHARWTPVADEMGTFWLSETPDKAGSKSWDSSLPRICTWARFVEKSTGKSVYVFNAHYDHRGQTARINSSKLIASRIASRKVKDAPVLFMGDLNAGETNDAIKYIKGRLVGSEQSPVPLVDTFRVLHPNVKNAGTFNSWSGRKTGDKIDYIFTLPPSDGAKVISAEIVYDNTNGRYPSDHFPVKTVVDF